MIALSPLWAGLLLPAALTLWWVYRSGDVSRERILGSTMLLERAKLVSRSIKWRPPWRALIEAALIIAIIAALLDLRIPAASEVYVVAIDNGPRMAALVSQKSSEVRLSLAKAQAISAVSELSRNAKIAVVTLNSTTDLLSVGDARTKISDLTIYYPGGSIVDAASRAKTALGAPAVTVISEGEFALPKPEWINWVSVSEQPLDNLALADFDPVSKALAIKSYSDAESQFILTIFSASGENIAQRKGTIGPSSVRRVSLSDVPNFPTAGSINLKAANDGLIVDNFLYFSSESPEGSIVVDSPLSIAALGLTDLTQFKFADKSSARSEANLFHRRGDIPKSCVGRRVVVMPQIGDGITRAETPESITWWSENDELLRYANLSLLAVPFTSSIEVQGAVPLISSKSGPLMTRYVTGECDTVTVGFELFPFSKTGNSTLSILTLNLLSWLSDSSVVGGLTWRAPAQKEAVQSEVVRIIPPSDAPIDASELITEPGLYRITKRAADSATITLRASSFSSPVVSDLRRITVHRAPIEGEITVKDDAFKNSKSNSTELLTWIVYGALLFLIVDVLVFGLKLGRSIGVAGAAK